MAEKASIVLRGGHVQTMVAPDDIASAVAVCGNRIAYVGDDAGAEAYIGEGTKVIDLDGRFVCPGFMDGHL
ncbi:MAG: amidohydrolase, partial [Atopobiaceae bacterium]|nr:amidohydrolase [Atopobiaceae bacterium]